MCKTITVSIVICFLFALSSCSTPPDAKTSETDEAADGNVLEKSAETATKPLTTTADVVFDSVQGVDVIMNDLMKKVNSAIPSPVKYDDNDE